MIITYIANTLFIIIILFVIWFVVCSIIYRYKPSNDLTGQQSERQKRNDDYNNDYYP
jgi:preprotein translocase subunit SecG